jgi:hypothetical membrane protein
MRWRRVGAIAGLAGALLFALFWMAAVQADGSWLFGENTLSELARTTGGGRDLFNAGVIVAALLWIPFALALIRCLPKEPFSRAGGMLFLLSAFALLAIGLFPIDTGAPHTVASWTFFAASMISLLLMIGPIGRSEVFGRIGIVPTIIAPLLSLGLLVLTSIPFAEAVAVVSLIAWASVISMLMLTNYGLVTRRR